MIQKIKYYSFILMSAQMYNDSLKKNLHITTIKVHTDTHNVSTCILQTCTH
jgi:hypothetical protein